MRSLGPQGVGQHYALVLDIVIARAVPERGHTSAHYSHTSLTGISHRGMQPPPPDMTTLTDVANERTGGIYKPPSSVMIYSPTQLAREAGSVVAQVRAAPLPTARIL